MTARERILEYLRAHPEWHYGLDIAKACDVRRSSIYVHLGRLEEDGKVERSYEAHAKYEHLGALPRTIYRIMQQPAPPSPSEAEPARQ